MPTKSQTRKLARGLCLPLLVSLAVILPHGTPAQAVSGSVTQTTAADFSGPCDIYPSFDGGNVVVSEDGTSPSDPNPGEITLQATFEDYFRDGTAPGPLWTTGNYGGTPSFVVNNGLATITSS